jgi:hypothetical protein
MSAQMRKWLKKSLKDTITLQPNNEPIENIQHLTIKFELTGSFSNLLTTIEYNENDFSNLFITQYNECVFNHHQIFCFEYLGKFVFITINKILNNNGTKDYGILTQNTILTIANNSDANFLM